VPFLLYRRTRGSDGAREYSQLHGVTLAGTGNGLVYPFVRRYAPAGAEVFPWGASVKDLLEESGFAPKDHAVVVDARPKEDVTLYELTDVWGHSYLDWTPIVLRLEELFVGEKPLDPERFKATFTDARCPRAPVYQFLHLQGGTVGGDWKWGPMGSTNGALLPPDALAFFLDMLQDNLAADDADDA